MGSGTRWKLFEKETRHIDVKGVAPLSKERAEITVYLEGMTEAENPAGRFSS
jgi:hypothetical protein